MRPPLSTQTTASQWRNRKQEEENLLMICLLYTAPVPQSCRTSFVVASLSRILWIFFFAKVELFCDFFLAVCGVGKFNFFFALALDDFATILRSFWSKLRLEMIMEEPMAKNLPLKDSGRFGGQKLDSGWFLRVLWSTNGRKLLNESSKNHWRIVSEGFLCNFFQFSASAHSYRCTVA